MIKKVLIVVIALASFTVTSSAQDLAIKTNLLYGGYTLTPNLGMEVKLAPRVTLDVSGGYNWFNLKGTPESNKKTAHWLAHTEVKYWLCESFNGHYFGLHLLGSQYNISQQSLPLLLGPASKNYRFEGYAAGAGVSYGYQLPIAKRWNLEFSLGLGYAYTKYDKYRCVTCGDKLAAGTEKHYFGPTKAAISLIFIIK